MKRFIRIIIILIIITTLISGCNQEMDYIEDVRINEKIINSKDFNVKSESTELETSVRGTIFLNGVKGAPKQAQIVAFIEIDRDDWGGVTFYIPDKWNISSITTSYPENEKIPSDYVAIWNTESTKYEWNTMIEIGRDRRYTSTEGGKGVIVVDLYTNEKTTSEVFSIMVGVGYNEKDGIKIIHPDHELIEIPIP